VNLNHWLVEQAWAFPTYYSSMTNEEIIAIDTLAKAARSKKRGVWKFLSKTVGTFDFTSREPKKNDTKVLANDKGPVLFPKLYRRFASWSARNKASVTKQTFQTFLTNGVGGNPTIASRPQIFWPTASMVQPTGRSMNSCSPERPSSSSPGDWSSARRRPS
jgi:hypothetical protein